MNKELLDKYVAAGEIHYKVREYITPKLTNGTKLIDICHLIESKIKDMSTQPQINNGVAFPTGIGINSVVAHYTPPYDSTKTLRDSDVCKIDYGVHIDGCIIDSAFTVNLNNKYNPVLDASRAAVDAIIKEVGVDSRFYDLSEISKEIVESYEIEINKKIKQLKPVNNICGHNIKQWNIHGGKLLYGIPQKDDTQKVEEDDILAIEIFASSGCGTCILDRNEKNYSHFMLKNDLSNVFNDNIPLFRNKKTTELYKMIKKNFKTLPFCPRFMDNIFTKHIDHTTNLKELFNNQIINCYPPLIEKDPTALVAQFEETIYVGDKKIILSQN